MISVRFENDYLKEIFINGKEKGKPVYGDLIVRAFVKKVTVLSNLNNSHDLTQIKSLNFEILKKELKGFYSVRVNKKYRIIFKIIKEKGGKEIIEIIEIHDLTDYH
jgi:proteic killer suppression protein